MTSRASASQRQNRYFNAGGFVFLVELFALYLAYPLLQRHLDDVWRLGVGVVLVSVAAAVARRIFRHKSVTMAVVAAIVATATICTHTGRRLLGDFIHLWTLNGVVAAGILIVGYGLAMWVYADTKSANNS